jgi:uncharacterized pyridoxamine 5'-phosphate oxidase family protein
MLKSLYIYPSTTKELQIAKQNAKKPIIVEPNTCTAIGLAEIEKNIIITDIEKNKKPLNCYLLTEECGPYQFVIANNSYMHQACIYETTMNTLGIFSCIDKNTKVEIEENQFFLIGMQKLFYRIEESNTNDSRMYYILYWIDCNDNMCSFNIKNEVTIGRSPINNVVFLNDPYMSRNHCILFCENNKVYLKNLSSNGVYCNIMKKGIASFTYDHENIKWGVVDGFQPVKQDLVVSCHNCLHFFITYIPWKDELPIVKY